MDQLADLPAGWQVWNAESEGRVVLAYRPDVFNGSAFPPACLPTVTVAPGASPDSRPDPHGRSGAWHVALYLEPDVRVRDVGSRFDSRAAAVEHAVAVADGFAAGEIDFRRAYQAPRDPYLDRLDDLVGGSD